MNSSRTATITSRTSLLPLRNTALAFLTLLLFPAVGSVAATPNRSPDLGNCQKLEVQGETPFFHVYATGVQIYRWNGTTWSLVGPDAVLYADPGHHAVVGTHYAGPTWETTSGSKVVGSVLDRCTADVNAVPWLLLEAVSTEGPGAFQKVTYIQRVNTTGGLAPVTSGAIGEEVRVPYTTEYFFYH
jgi:hypothetical protein